MKHPSALAALAAAVLLITGCGTGSDNSGTGDAEPKATEDEVSTAPDPQDEFQSLNVSMVAQSGTYFPNGVEGVTLGCSDTLVNVATVPIEAETTEEHVSAAIQFLLDDSQYYHGDPSVTNSLTLSETLELASVETGRNSVTIELTGDVVVRGSCEASRIQAQLYGTAASTTEVEDVSITVDGTSLNEVLGLEAFDTSQLSENPAA